MSLPCHALFTDSSLSHSHVLYLQDENENETYIEFSNYFFVKDGRSCTGGAHESLRDMDRHLNPNPVSQTVKDYDVFIVRHKLKYDSSQRVFHNHQITLEDMSARVQTYRAR